jgi:hypothetical protein
MAHGSKLERLARAAKFAPTVHAKAQELANRYPSHLTQDMAQDMGHRLLISKSKNLGRLVILTS